MKKNTFAIFLVFSIIFSSTSQEKVFEIHESSFNPIGKSKESFSVPNQRKTDVMLLIKEKMRNMAYLLDINYKIKSSIFSEKLPKNYSDLLGYNIQGNTYCIFFSNSKNTKYGVQIFDFENKTSSIQLLDFKIKKESFVETINYNNKFHLITISNNTSDLNIYTFNQNFEFQKNTISLKELEYENSIDGSIVTAYDKLMQYDISKVESNVPNAIEVTSKKIKLYLQDDQLLLTFDHRSKETHIYHINLESFTSTYQAIAKPSKMEKGYKISNSYIYYNKIFQIASSPKKMRFTIKKLETGKLIKEYVVKQKDSITFKNSPIIQDGFSFFTDSSNKVRKMEKTSKYLRKISLSDIGISAYKINNKFNLRLGSFKEVQSGGAPMPGFQGMPITSVGGFNLMFNGYHSYTSATSTYINCLFDDNFEHLEGKVEENVYDKIKKFENELKSKPKAINIFTHKDRFYYGFYDKEKKNYEIYKF
ncbi:hypothetical protein [Aquimarina algicola]|uniref:Uncharacterized protein n=1 Tax=Aquimarina algicola TaxID=2589995 RepID=A0A504JBG6_9FLAO|nr:hypothetical protein [Aquimarina algicola]TPN83910.1 hypothetical protein FHK87_18265 [Aquimarina algicola]